VSLQNILLKVYDGGALSVRLSDFGLVKVPDSEMTRTGTDLKGVFRDPTLGSFKDYALTNEIYAIGCVLSYLFTGRKGLGVATGDVARIIERCTTTRVSERYSTTRDIHAAVERL
jgi:serine/threonine protein kinase